MTAPFTTRRRVEFRETDMAGIVHFSNYFSWMEQAEHEAWRSLGLGVNTTIDGQAISWPRVSATCDYRRALRFEDVIDVEFGLERMGTKSLTWRTRFLHEGTLVAEGRMTAACCHVAHDQPPVAVEIPEMIRKAVEGLLWPVT